MKKILLSLILLTSALSSFGQAGSQALSGVFLRVNDTTTYQTQAATRHAQGYYDIYFNNQAVTPHWDVWNGSSYDHIFDFNSGTAGPSTSHNKLPIEYRTDDFDLVPGDTSKLLVLDDGVGITLDLASAVDGSQFVWWNPSPSLPPGISAGGTVVLDTGLYTYAHYNNDTLRIANGGSGGGSGGAVSSVFGRTGAVVAVSGDYEADEVTNTPAGTIAATDVQAAVNELDTEKVPTSRTISTTSPLSGGGDLSANRTITIADAAADGSTKGAASFTANDFNASSGNISIDYTNGQSAASGTKGFLTGADWDTFNGKQATGLSWLLASGGTLSGANTISASATNTLDFQYSGTIGTTVNRLFMISNTNAASAGSQQISPPFIQRGRGWATGSGGSSMTVDFASYTVPVQGTTEPTGIWTLASGVNGSSFTNRFTVNSGTGIASASGFSIITTNMNIDANTTVFRIRNNQGTTAGYGVKLYGGSASATSGNQTSVAIGNVADGMTFSPTSGTATFTLLGLENVINQTGGANGAVTMLNITPTYTSAGGNVTGIDYNPTVTSISGNHTGLRIRAGHASIDNGNLTLGSVGNKILVKEGSGGFMGQATLSSGTIAITVSGVTTSTRCFLTRVTPSGTTLTTDYDCVCTSNTVTIQADVAAGTINTADNSTLNYMLFEPAP